MIVYKRNIEKKLFVERILFVAMTALCVYAFSNGFTNAGYLLAVIWITTSLIVIKNVVIETKVFEIKKFYFFGIITKTYPFAKGSAITIKSFDADYGEKVETTEMWDVEPGPDGLLSLPFLRPRITHRNFTIKELDDAGVITKKVKIGLDKNELALLQDFTSKDQL